MRFVTAFVMFFIIFSQFCVAAPTVAVDVARRSVSVFVQRPVLVQNVPVAQVGVPFVFQLDPNTFTAVDSDSGATSSVQLTISLDHDSNIPTWINFNPDNLIFSGTPDAVSDAPYHIRLVATAPGSDDRNDTAFDLYTSDTPAPYIINTLEYQQNAEVMHITNASYLSTAVGVWVRPRASFEVQVQPFCNSSIGDSSLYYTAYQPTNSTVDPLPEWVHFDSDTLSLTGTAPEDFTSTDIVLRCSNILGGGGPEQRMVLEVTEHMLELDGTSLSFQFAPGYMFSYDFDWLWTQLYLDGRFVSRRFPMNFSNSSIWNSQESAFKQEVGISFSLDKYPWLSFNRQVAVQLTCYRLLTSHYSINRTITGTPPIVETLPKDFPSVPLNISCRGREINTEIAVYSLAASAWHSYREIAASIIPGSPYSHNFTKDLLESVASNPNWSVFARINDPLNSTSWLTFNATTHVLYGTAPMDSPSRDIDILLTSNAWGFNTSIPYRLSITNQRSPSPALGSKSGWTPIAVALSIALAITFVLLALAIFIFCGLRKGWIVSPLVLVSYHRREGRSSQTLVETNSNFSASCCKGTEFEKADDSNTTSRPAEQDVETQLPISTYAREQPNQVHAIEVDTSISKRSAALSSDSQTATSTVPTSAATFLTVPTTSHFKSTTSTVASDPFTKHIPRQSLKKHLKIFKKRSAFGKKPNKRTKRSVSVPSVNMAKDPPFTPVWKGHVYQTPELLQAEERAWQARRLERKDRLKREYLARKQAEAKGISMDDRFPSREGSNNVPKPGAARRFGIFEQLARMEDLDRKGPANMRGGSMPCSRLVEIGENRFFNDTMLDRSDVGSSEFSSLASWETLSESSLPDMVLCYGQLGRRKQREDAAPREPRAVMDPSAVQYPPLNKESELPGPAEDTLTDENTLDRIAQSLGSGNSLGEIAFGPESPEGGAMETFEEMANNSVIVCSPVKWKGKGVARGEHGSPTTSQHSPTFKKLAHQRVRASMDSTFGSPLSRMAAARALAYGSPASRSVGSVASGPETDLSSSKSLANVLFQLGEKGVQFYFVTANSRFNFTARVNDPNAEQDTKPTFGYATSVYGIQMEDSHAAFMPLWLHFNGSTLEFWGHTPETSENLQYSVRIVRRSTNKVVGRLTIVVTQSDQGEMGATGPAPPSPKPTPALCSAHSPRTFGIPPQSFRSIATSHTGTDLSSSGSMTSIVFHLNQDGVHLFVIPSTTKFCFRAPIDKANGDPPPVKPAFGRTVASPYAIQLEECDVSSVPLWLHFVPQSMEFWGEAPSVDQPLHVAMRIIRKQTDEVAGRITIIIAHIDDVARLQAEFGYSHATSEGLSVVEEVSSIDSDEVRADPQDETAGSAGPQTPKRSRNLNASMTVSSSRGIGSWRGGRSPASRRSLVTPPSRRNIGTPRSKSGARLRTPASGRLTAYEDYDSVMFEGRSCYSESICGPELSTLTGNGVTTIPNAALDAVSRAASREGSVRLSLCDQTLVVVPTVMNGVEYFVIPKDARFRFALKLPKTESRNKPRYDVVVEEQQIEGWTFPGWIHGRVDDETGVVELSGSTCDVGEHEEHTLIVYEEGGQEVKRVQVVVAPDVSA